MNPFSSILPVTHIVNIWHDMLKLRTAKISRPNQRNLARTQCLSNDHQEFVLSFSTVTGKASRTKVERRLSMVRVKQLLVCLERSGGRRALQLSAICRQEAGSCRACRIDPSIKNVDECGWKVWFKPSSLINQAMKSN